MYQVRIIYSLIKFCFAYESCSLLELKIKQLVSIIITVKKHNYAYEANCSSKTKWFLQNGQQKLYKVAFDFGIESGCDFFAGHMPYSLSLSAVAKGDGEKGRGPCPS